MKQHHSLIGKLMDLVEETAQNAEYPEFFVNDRCLVDHTTYLNLCKYIFPELKPHLSEIESIDASPAEKINFLLELLSEALQYDFSNVDGLEISRYNLSHIQRLVVILHEYSKIVKETANRNKRPIVRSEEGSSTDKNREANIPPHSARVPKEKQNHERDHRENRKKQQREHNYPKKKEREFLYSEKSEQENEQKHVHYAQTNDYLIPSESSSKKKASLKKKNRKTRNQNALRDNLHEKIVTTIMKEKTRMLSAQNRDNRKDKMQFMKEAKQKYKIYLQRYAKDNKAKANRETVLAIKSASAVRPIKQELPREDFDRIDGFFQSFAHRFRDKKAAYLRKITQLVRKQELDRFCFQNRIERDAKKYMQERLQQELEGARHQHRIKSEMIKESAQNLEHEVSIMKKEELRAASAQRRELKDAKKRELMQIQNVLREDNEKVLMSLEEGGRLEKLIMKIYKKM